MSHDHPSDELLVIFSEDPTALPSRDAIVEHLSDCLECRQQVADYRAIEAALREKETWSIAADREEESAQEEVALEARIAREDADAERILRPFLETPYRFAASNVPQKKRFHTGGVVRLLCRTAYDECDREPLFAIYLAEAATFIAEALPDNYYPAEAVNDFRGMAWKEYSTACRYVGRFDEGLEALQRAERAYRRLPFPTPGVSSVSLGRAGVLWQLQRYDDALQEVQKAARGFLSYGDNARYLDAKQVEAVILHRQGNLGAACATYESMYEAAENMNDPELLARAARNLGVTATERGDLGTACKYLIIALQAYEALDQHAMVLQIRWRIGVLTLTAGNFKEAVRRLRQADAEFEAAGMMSMAAWAKLDLAEALLMTGETEEVKILCESLLTHFHAVDMLSIDIYLRDCYARRTVARVSELAQKLDSSRQHLTRIIRQHFGKRLCDVICAKQLAYAAQLLRYPHLTVDDIGGAAAFGHRSTFYRTFKEHFGMTPNEYRPKATGCNWTGFPPI